MKKTIQKSPIIENYKITKKKNEGVPLKGYVVIF